LQWFAANGDSLNVPLVPYLDWVASLVRHAVRRSPSLVLYMLASLAAAGWFGHRGFGSDDPLGRRS
jgi:hypothetical protein